MPAWAERALDWARPDGWRRPIEAAALAIVCMLVAWPVLAAHWLPFVDYPEHLGTIAALHGAGGDARFTPYFVADYPRTQYLLFYLLGDLLVGPLGIEGAGRATVMLSVATLPLSIAVWLREHGRPPLLGALAAGVAMHVFVLWGFLNYAMGMTLGVLALAALARVVRRPDVVSATWLALAALATFYAHAQLFAWFGVCAIVQTTAMLKHGGWPRLKRAVAYATCAAIPSVIGVAVWLRNSGVIERGVAGTRNGSAAALADAPPGFHPAGETVTSWARHSFGMWNDGSGMDVAIAFAIVALLMVIARALGSRGPFAGPASTTFAERIGKRAPLAPPVPSIGPELVLLTTVLLYLFAPYSYRNIEPINERFLPLALALLPAVGPRARLGAAARGILAAACIAMTFYASSVHRDHFRQTDAEMGDLRAALDHTEPGARVLGLIFDRDSTVAGLPVYLHAHQYYQAYRGGLAAFGFVEFPISPIQYVPGAEPPPFPPRFEWTPERYEHSVYGEYFDYWLVRHREGRAPRTIFRGAAEGAEPEAVYEGSRWTVFRRRSE